MRKADYSTLLLALIMVLSAAGLSDTVSARFVAPSNERAPGAALATAPTLGTAEEFAVLAGSTATNAGPTIITGDFGVFPGTAITGFPPGIVNGTTYAGDTVAQQAQDDVTTAYTDLASQACDVNLTGQDLGGLTLVQGVYCFDVAAALTGVLTLDAEGDPAAVWVFQIGSTLTTATGASVLMINGANACNVYWQVGSSATLGTDTVFAGSIVALASITLNTGTDIVGRALASGGAVTMDTNEVNVDPCILQVLPTATPTNTLTPTATATETSTPTNTLAPTATIIVAATPTSTLASTATVPAATATVAVATATSAVTATATTVAATATVGAATATIAVTVAPVSGTATTDATAAATTVPTSGPTPVATSIAMGVPTDAAGPALTATLTIAAPTPTGEAVQSRLPAAGVQGDAGGGTGGLVGGIMMGLSAMMIVLRSRRRTSRAS